MQTDNPTLLADNHLTVGSGEALGIYFNQDHGCFTVSTETGFSVYNTNPIGKRFTRGKAVWFNQLLHKFNYFNFCLNRFWSRSGNCRNTI